MELHHALLHGVQSPLQGFCLLVLFVLFLACSNALRYIFSIFNNCFSCPSVDFRALKCYIVLSFRGRK